MLPSRPASGGPFTRSIREALESAVSPAVAQEILIESLRKASLSAVPEDVESFRRFCEGPFRRTVRGALGMPNVEQIFERLGHVLWMATSDVQALEAARAWSRGTPTLKDDDSGVRHVEQVPGRPSSASPFATDPQSGVELKRAPTMRAPSPLPPRNPTPVAGTPVASDAPRPSLDAPGAMLGRMRAPTQQKLPAATREVRESPSRPGLSIDPREEAPQMPAGVAFKPSQPPGMGRFTPLPPPPAPLAGTPTPVRRSSSPPSAARLPSAIIVISLDPQLVSDIRDDLRGQCPVRSVGTPTELAGALARAGDRLVVLVDTALPAIELPTFAGLAPILPPTARVVLWGAAPRQQQRLATAYPLAASWIPSGPAPRAGRFILDLP